MNIQAELSMEGMLELVADARREMARVVVGQEETLDLVLAAILCEGHVLLEGVPGIGKTLIATSAAGCLSLDYGRIQFTPDLMPSDVLGASMLEEKGGQYGLRFEKGPVFANLVLADEINRASPKTQSALLEAMQERAVTVRGETMALPRPFIVLATQNPLEMEGTYPLPEAQTDRFLFKAIVRHPGFEDLVRIVGATTGQSQATARPVVSREGVAALQRAVRAIEVPPAVVEYAARAVMMSQGDRPDAPKAVKAYCRYGAGPRGAQALVMAARAAALLDGRFHAGMKDLERFLVPALRHRVSVNFEGQSEGIRPEDLVRAAAEAARLALGPDPSLGPSAALSPAGAGA